MKLEIRLDAEHVAPGEELAGHILVLDDGASRALRLTVSFRERSPAYLETLFAESVVIHEGDLATGQTVAFRYEMPDWAQPGVKGKHGELFWELEATSDEPGRDTHVRRRIDVVA